VYNLINSRFYPGALICAIFEQLKESSKSRGGDALFHVDFDVVFQTLFIIDIKIGSQILEFRYKYLEDKQSIDKSRDPFLLIMSELVNNNDLSDIFNGKNKSLSEMDIELLEKMAIELIDKHYETNQITLGDLKADEQRKLNIKNLKWIKACLEMKQVDLELKFGNNRQIYLTDHVSDPLLKFALINISREICNYETISLVARARGLKLSSVSDKLGYSCMYESDEQFLENNFSKLSEGTYAINFDCGKRNHAITYIKEKDKEYILDPNGIMLQCKDSSDSIFHLQKLLTFYSESNKQSPLYKNEHPNHNIRIRKIEKELVYVIKDDK
jgi:hypothetical protein